MSCGVAAVIADVVCGLGGKIVKGRDLVKMALMVIAFVLTFFLKVNVIFIILGAIAVGVLRVILARKGDAV